MSLGVAVKTLDSAGGPHLAGGQTKVTARGQLVVVLGDPVTPHGGGPHLAPVMQQGSSKFRIGGKPVVLSGHKASCDHQSTGRPDVTCSV